MDPCISMHGAKQYRVQWLTAQCNREQLFRIVILNSRREQPLRAHWRHRSRLKQLFLSTLVAPKQARAAFLIALVAPKQARTAFSSGLAAPGQARAAISSAPAAPKQARTAHSSALAAPEQAGAGHFERQVAPVQHLHVFLHVFEPQQRKAQKRRMRPRSSRTRARTFV